MKPLASARATAGRPRGLAWPAAAAIDAVAIVAFVILGRREHEQPGTWSGLATTATPFLIGLAIGWLALRVWRRPTSLPAAVILWPITVLVGMVLRSAVFDGGTATAFVLVATGFIGTCLVGWRAAWSGYSRRTATTAS